MYKKYKFKPNSLSPHPIRYSYQFQKVAEKLIPFLIITATFVWLWK